jgi:DNA ligase (NAD+)
MSHLEDLKVQEDLKSLDGIGAMMILEMVNFFSQPHHQEIIQELMSYLTIEEDIPSEKETFLKGKTVVFTGSLETMTRAEAKAQAERVGAKVGSSVSKKTDYVIVGADAGSKAENARALGVPILTEAEWRDLLQQA